MVKPHKKDNFYIFGKYFGFPDCCIESFYTLEHVGGPPRKLSGTGYIPCLKCNEKTEEELIAAIQENRECKTPFPKEDTKTIRKMLKEF